MNSFTETKCERKDEQGTKQKGSIIENTLSSWISGEQLE